MLNFMHLLTECNVYSLKQTLMENLIWTGHCAGHESLVPQILQVVYWDLSLRLSRRGRTLQDWRFTQQCDRRFKPLGCDTVLVATFYDCLTTEDEDTVPSKYQELLTKWEHHIPENLIPQVIPSPLLYDTQAEGKLDLLTLFFTVSASTVQYIYCFHHHTVCQTYIKKYSEANGICFQHQVYRTCCILNARGFHCWSVIIRMVTPWHIILECCINRKKMMVHDKWIVTTMYCWNLCGVTEETTINQVCCW